MMQQTIPDESPSGERLETIEEMFGLMAVVQKVGHRLAYETHSEAYDLVNDLNLSLHQAHLQLEQIRRSL